MGLCPPPCVLDCCTLQRLQALQRGSTLLQGLLCAHHRVAVCREAVDPGRLASIHAELKARVLPRLVLLLIGSLNHAANPKVTSCYCPALASVLLASLTTLQVLQGMLMQLIGMASSVEPAARTGIFMVAIDLLLRADMMSPDIQLESAATLLGWALQQGSLLPGRQRGCLQEALVTAVLAFLATCNEQMLPETRYATRLQCTSPQLAAGPPSSQACAVHEAPPRAKLHGSAAGSAWGSQAQMRGRNASCSSFWRPDSPSVSATLCWHHAGQPSLCENMRVSWKSVQRHLARQADTPRLFNHGYYGVQHSMCDLHLLPTRRCADAALAQQHFLVLYSMLRAASAIRGQAGCCSGPSPLMEHLLVICAQVLQACKPEHRAQLAAHISQVLPLIACIKAAICWNLCRGSETQHDESAPFAHGCCSFA